VTDAVPWGKKLNGIVKRREVEGAVGKAKGKLL